MYRICCNKACGQIVHESECVDYKHPTGERLCPECYEVTEAIGDSSELFNGDGQIVCSRCACLFGIEYSAFTSALSHEPVLAPTCSAVFRLLRLTKAGQVQVKGRFAFTKHLTNGRAEWWEHSEGVKHIHRTRAEAGKSGVAHRMAEVVRVKQSAQCPRTIR